MATHISHAALPYPIKHCRYTVQVPFLDADGDPTDPTTPDTEVSQDGGAYADAAEEVTTITGSNGSGYVTITGAEMNNSAVFLAFKVASGPKATLMTLYPRVLASVGTGTLSAGSAGGGTLGTALAYDITGCFVKTTGGTGGGGTGGANNQVRKIITYNTGTGAFTVAPNWETTPSTDTTYDILLPEGVTLGMLKTLNPATAGRTVVVDAAGLVDANTVKVGPTGSGTAQTARDLGATLGAAGAGLTAVPWNAAWDAEVQSEVEDALVVHRLDELLNADSDIDGAAPPTVGSVFHELMTKTAGSFTYDQATDSLEALRDRGDAAWITATGFSTHSAADVWSVATRVLTAGTNLNNLSAADVLTQVNAAIDTAIAELGVAAPTATPTLRTGLMLLYMALRNKTTSTATQTTISNNAGTTIATAAQSDDTVTYEKGEFA